jgi:hypothetical protein
MVGESTATVLVTTVGVVDVVVIEIRARVVRSMPTEHAIIGCSRPTRPTTTAMAVDLVVFTVSSSSSILYSSSSTIDDEASTASSRDERRLIVLPIVLLSCVVLAEPSPERG